MSTKERILTIRLLEKIKELPAYAESIGIEVLTKYVDPESNMNIGRSK